MQCKDQKFAEVKFPRQVDMQVQFKRFKYPPACKRVWLCVTMLPPQEPRSPGGHHHPGTGTRPGSAQRLAGAGTLRGTPTQVSLLLFAYKLSGLGPLCLEEGPPLPGPSAGSVWPT